MLRKLRIFDYTWHISHQYDMMSAMQDDCDFFHCLNIKKQWDTSIRPKPQNLNFVFHYQSGTYDLAILHIDQQVVNPLDLKTLVYNEFNELIKDIPKIVVCHGTPVNPEFFNSNAYKLDPLEMQQLCVTTIKKMVGNNTMVVNSFAAAGEYEWGFGHPIVHGMDADNWWDLPKEPRVFTALAPYGLDEACNRKCILEVADELFNAYGYTLAYARVNIDTGSSLDDYKNYLGRSLLYLDTSFRTPMNRARTEAFLSGCCVIQVEGAHDLNRWAKHEENIFLVPNDPKKIAATIADFIENRYQKALEIGRTGKEMAKLTFNPGRYRDDWLKLFDQVLSQAG